MPAKNSLKIYAPNSYYHLYNRGVEKRIIFIDEQDYQVFLSYLKEYLMPKDELALRKRLADSNTSYKEKNKILKALRMNNFSDVMSLGAYCLMPNHFHLLIKQLKDGGISEFMRRFIHSYTKYRNTKYRIQGPTFQGLFKAVLIETDEQLLHVSRYIHLNPLVSHLLKDLSSYPWSSYPTYIGLNNDDRIAKTEILSFFKSPKAYEQFILDQADYGITLEAIKHQLIDIDQ